MKNYHLRFGTLVCALLVLIVTAVPVYAASAEAGWDVPYVGRMNGPDGFKALDFENWMKELQSALSKNQVKVPGDATSQIAKNPFVMPEELRFYQLQVNDGRVYHIAFAMVIRDSKGMIPGVSSFFADTLAAEQSKQLVGMNDKISLGISMMQAYTAQTGFMTLQVLNLKPLTRLKEAPEVIYSLRGRVIFDMKGLITPMFAKGYVLERSGKAVVLVILTNDADGPYWEKTTDDMMRTITRTIRFSTNLY